MADIISMLVFLISAHPDYQNTQPESIGESYWLCRLDEAEIPEHCKSLELWGETTDEYMFNLRYDIDPDNEEDRARLMHEFVRWT